MQGGASVVTTRSTQSRVNAHWSHLRATGCRESVMYMFVMNLDSL